MMVSERDKKGEPNGDDLWGEIPSDLKWGDILPGSEPGQPGSAEAVASDFMVQTIAEAYRDTGNPDFRWAAEERKRRKDGQEIAPAASQQLDIKTDFPLIPYRQLSSSSVKKLSNELNAAFCRHLESLGVDPALARTVQLHFCLPYTLSSDRSYSHYQEADEHSSNLGMEGFNRTWLYDEEFTMFLDVDRGPWCAPRTANDVATKGPAVRWYDKNNYNAKVSCPVNPSYLDQLQLVEAEVGKLTQAIIAKSRTVNGKHEGRADDDKVHAKLTHCVTTHSKTHPHFIMWLGGGLQVSCKGDRSYAHERMPLKPLELAEIIGAQCKDAHAVDLEPYRKEIVERDKQREEKSPFAIREKNWIRRYEQLPPTPDDAELSHQSTLALNMMVDRLLAAKFQQLDVPKKLIQSMGVNIFDGINHTLVPALRMGWSEAIKSHKKNEWDKDDTHWPWVTDEDGMPVEKAAPEFMHPSKTVLNAVNFIRARLGAQPLDWDKVHWDYGEQLHLGKQHVTPLRIAEAVNQFCNQYGGKTLGQAIDLTPFYEEAFQRNPEHYITARQGTDRPSPDHFLPSAEEISERARHLQGKIEDAQLRIGEARG